MPNPPNCSVIGGFVYRGKAVPAAVGRYFFSDNCASRVRSVAAGGGTQARDEPFTVEGLSSFGEDARGELYMTSFERQGLQAGALGQPVRRRRICGPCWPSAA